MFIAGEALLTGEPLDIPMSLSTQLADGAQRGTKGEFEMCIEGGRDIYVHFKSSLSVICAYSSVRLPCSIREARPAPQKGAALWFTVRTDEGWYAVEAGLPRPRTTSASAPIFTLSARRVCSCGEECILLERGDVVLAQREDHHLVVHTAEGSELGPKLRVDAQVLLQAGILGQRTTNIVDGEGRLHGYEMVGTALSLPDYVRSVSCLSGSRAKSARK